MYQKFSLVSLLCVLTFNLIPFMFVFIVQKFAFRFSSYQYVFGYMFIYSDVFLRMGAQHTLFHFCFVLLRYKKTCLAGIKRVISFNTFKKYVIAIFVRVIIFSFFPVTGN